MNQKTIIPILVAFIAFSLTLSGTAFAAPIDQNFNVATLGDTHSQSYTLDGVTYTTNDAGGLNIYIVNDGNIALGADQALAYRSSYANAVTQVSFATADGSEFKLNSFVISTGLGDTTITVKGYKDNVEVASTPVTTASYVIFDVSSDINWENIDEVRMTGSDLDIDIDDLDFSSAVLPYSVTYNGNTNTSGFVPTDENTYDTGDMITVLGNTGNLAKDGYTFAGWNGQADGEGVSFNAGDTFAMGSSDVTLYAQWEEIPVPISNFSANVTSGALPLSVDFTDLSLNNPTGWSWYFGDEDISQTWTLMNSNAWRERDRFSSAVLPDGSILIMGGYDYVFTGEYLGDVWRSTNNGTTWTQIASNTAWGERNGHSSVALSDGTVLLMGGHSGGFQNTVYRSDDKGATWAQVTTSGSVWPGRERHTSVVLPDDSIVVMGGYNGAYLSDVWRSNDAGVSWTQMNASAWPARNQHSSVVLPDGSIVVMGGSNGPRLDDVWRSTDNGATWEQMTDNAEWGTRYMHSSVALPDGSIMLMGGNNGVNQDDVWRSTDSGATWTEVSSNSAWSARGRMQSEVLPDGSVLLMGGSSSNSNQFDDVYRLTTASTSEQNPVHTYNEIGTYQVTLQAFNSGGYNNSIKTGYITVAVEPVSNFTANVTSGANPLSVAFTDQSENEPTSWEWNFGDGSTSTDQNPTHTYAAAGTYNVSLNVSNIGGSNNKTVTTYITVANIPVADFTSNVTSGALPLTVNFSDQSTNEPTEWEWNFGDGNTSTEQNPTHTYSTVGTYNVSLNATNAGGSNSTSVTDYITVAVAPVANFTTDITSGTAPLTVTFTDLSTNGPTAWEWDFGDGTTATSQNPTHTYSDAGTYTVSLNASNVGGSNVTTMTGYITVNAPEEDSSSRRSIPVSQPSDIVVSTHSSMQRILGGSSIEYDLSQTESPVVSIKFDAKDNAGLVIASVQVLSDSPDNTPAPNGDSYQLLSIDVGKQGTISNQNAENILINFRVSREWILENNLDPATIRMARYHEGEWEELPTDRIDEDDEFLYFAAETQGFSIFSVIGDEVKATTEEETPVTAEFADDEPKESAPAEDKSTPGFTTVMGLVFVTVAFLIVRKFN